MAVMPIINECMLHVFMYLFIAAYLIIILLARHPTIFSAVKRLIVINRIQNKSCLHNICVCTVHIYYVFIYIKHTHTAYI